MIPIAHASSFLLASSSSVTRHTLPEGAGQGEALSVNGSAPLHPGKPDDHNQYRVQIDEANGVIKRGRVPNLRLAYLLIESVTELILHRTAQTELQRQSMLKKQLLTYRRSGGRGRCHWPNR
jgi:hypothetical protein